VEKHYEDVRFSVLNGYLKMPVPDSEEAEMGMIFKQRLQIGTYASRNWISRLLAA